MIQIDPDTIRTIDCEWVIDADRNGGRIVARDLKPATADTPGVVVLSGVSTPRATVLGWHALPSGVNDPVVFITERIGVNARIVKAALPALYCSTASTP